jgi:hypothetical protein
MKKLIFIILIFSLSIQIIFAQADNLPSPTLKTTKHGSITNINASQQALFSGFDSTQVESGILYDNVIFPFSNIEKHNGSDNSKTISKKEFKQICLELEKANLKKKKLILLDSKGSTSLSDNSIIPITLINFNYDKLKNDALEKGLIQKNNGKFTKSIAKNESPFLTKKVFASSTMIEHTFRGTSLKFHLNRNNYFSNTKEKLKSVLIDFDDGLGFRNVTFDQDIPVSYQSEGTKTITVKLTNSANSILTSSSLFTVEALTTTSHTDVALTADIPYNGVYASGKISLFKSPSTADVRNPIIFLEGLDLDNSLHANGIFQMLSGSIDPLFTNLGWANGPDMATCLLNNGYDIIIVDYDESRTYIQANAMLVVKILQYVNSTLKAGKNSNVLIGASMGGLVGRYALSYMEKNSLDHQTRLFISDDSPQKGANVPLGDQYWINFWASESADAATNIQQLNTIAPQQMLVYHHLYFPNVDPYRTTFVNELTNLGYPNKCRNVAFTNGSANGTGEPYSPGAQLVSWRFRNWKVDVDGNTWAVPNISPQTQIVYCMLDKFGPNYSDFSSSVTGTLPYDNAPGGMRATNQQIADGSTYNSDFGGNLGDITTNNPTHCFIPTTSALDINTSDLFYNIQGDPNILAKTPFKAIYYPVNNVSSNQPHMYITSETVGWILNELIPDYLVQDGTTRNIGNLEAKARIRFMPGVHADATSQLHAFIGTYSPCSLSASALKSVSNQNILVEEDEANQPKPVNDFYDKSQITIYPNPSNGKFTIVMPFLENTEIEVYDLNGTLVLKTKSNSNLINLDLTNCHDGVYSLKIKYANDQFVGKIVIAK